jgi:hypothetical protein
LRFGLWGSLLLTARVAFADQPVDRPEATEVDRDAPPIGRVELGFDGGAPVPAWGAGVQLGYVAQPIALRTATRTIYPVDHRETLALGGAIAVGTSAVVDLRMPFAHQIGARLAGLGDERHLDRWVPGDLAIGARIQVATRDRLSLFLRGQLTLPTGDDRDFAGEARWTAAWLVIARAWLPGDIIVAATAGVRLRGAEVRIANRLTGDELLGGVGVSVPIPPIPRLWCDRHQVSLSAEIVGVLGDDVAGQRSPSPAEARIGFVGRPRPDLAIGVRVGAGLDDQIGAPAYRGVLEAAWTR